MPDLTPAQTKELLRRLADSSDPRRYLIISRMLPGARFILYYNVSDDVFAWNDPDGGTLFKRRKAAELIQSEVERCIHTTSAAVGRWYGRSPRWL